MNKVTALMAGNMLTMASGEFASHGCNDLELENTPENQAFVADMETWNDPKWEGEINISSDGKWIYTSDYFVMAYCAHLIRQEAKK